jgi:hypothetical protein
MGSEVKESLERGTFRPFAVSHDKVVKVMEDIGIKSSKFGPLREIIQFVLRPNFCKKMDKII